MSDRSVRFPLRIKLAVFAALLLIVHIVGVGWAAIELTRATVETSYRELQIAVLEVVAEAIEHELSQAQDGLDAIGRTLTNDTLSEDARISMSTVLVESNEVLDNAIIYDAKGEVITPIVEGRLENFQTPPTLAAELREVATIEGVATGLATVTAHGPRLPIVVPLRAEDTVTGYAVSLVSTAEIQRRVESQADAHFTDLTNALYVVDEEQRYLAHPNRELADTLASGADEGALRGIELGEKRRFSQSAEYTGSDGSQWVGTVVGLRARRWALVAQVPRDVAYAPVTRVQRIVTGAVIAALVIAMIASVVLSRQVTSPIEQLSTFADSLARRNFTETVEIKTSDELAVLGRAMSQAANDLQASEVRIREEEAIRADLGRYLPAELVDKVVKREQDMGLGGARREITVLFADVVAFTPLTQELEPEATVQILNELFTILTDIVFRHDGTVDKFIGDCVMAIWGAPSDEPDHAARALEAAEEIVSWLEIGNANWKKKYGVTIQIAVGINSGEAVVGNIGSKTRMEYTAIGDAVNVAARLEAIARPQQILITEQTKEAAGDGFSFTELGERTLAGHETPTRLFELNL
ncbi:MAG: adenylate/guanylate cyclase domain-containing protein [Nannocystales bacterium]